MKLHNAADATIIAALAKLVDDQPEAGTHVILEPDSPKGSNYYVQFALDERARLYCEAVSNQYLEPPFRLDSEQILSLERLGWRTPEYDGQNWFRIFRPNTTDDYQDIVRLIHRAFREVYRSPDDVSITMTTWEGPGDTAAQGEPEQAQPDTSGQGTPCAQDADLASTLDSYDFCRTPAGGLGRRRALGLGRIVVCGEVYVPSLLRWRLDDTMMREDECPTLSPEEALALIEGAAALNAACPDPADLAQHDGGAHKERLDWLDVAIATTLEQIRTEEQEVTNELPWARPGSWDYDFEIDTIAWIKLAYATLQRLFEEKQILLSRQAMRDRTSYDD